MTVKKALIIGTLAVILTGITACAVAYNKKTGKSLFKQQAVQTNAYSEFTDYQYNNNNPNWTITGTVDTVNNGYAEEYQKSTNNRPLGEYRITKTGNEIYSYVKLDKIASEEFSAPYYITVNKQQSKTYNIPSGKQVKSINITVDCYREVVIMDMEYWAFDFWFNYTFTDNTAYRNFVYIEYAFGELVYYFEDYENIPFDYIDVETNIATLHHAYQSGYSSAGQYNEVVDVRGMMLNIITMPFTFISQAFNVTMWEGTPYAINLSNLILSLIAIATILFIIRLFTTGFSAIGNYTGSKTNSRLDKQNKRSQTRLNNAKADKIEKGK